MGTRWGQDGNEMRTRWGRDGGDEKRRGVNYEGGDRSLDGGSSSISGRGEASCTLGDAHESGSRRGAYRSAFPPY